MALETGSSIGGYEVLAFVGAGGMGEVYRARDTKLDRDVALKVLPDSLTSDPERLARFTREAKTLASLNHPNIAAIYGFEDSGGVRALVMELVEGEDLSEKLKLRSEKGKGPYAQSEGLPLDEVLPIAKQIAEALEAAHEQGIVHRDLKPANVKVRPDGMVKVLDFGLAKAIEGAGEAGTSGRAGGEDLSRSPTLTAATMQGMILGTAGYMAPEQARGKNVDKRADIWAFGVVVFEMLTSRRTFVGEDISLTLASVMMKEPDWGTLPASTPADLRRLLIRCLKKDPKARLRDIGEARLQIEDLINGVAEPQTMAVVAPARVVPTWRRAMPAILATLLTALAAGLGALAVWFARPAADPPIVTRFAFELGEGQRFTNGGRPLVAMSPDGTKMVYVANRRLWLRSMSDTEARPIAGSEPSGSAAVTSPVFSPDGQIVAFWSDQALKRIPVTGGAASTICPADNPYGMSWTGDEILVGQSQGIMRVSATGGGTLQPLVAVKTGERAASPRLLPDGDHVLFSLGGSGPDIDKGQIVVQSVKSGERRTLIPAGWDGRYMPSGHLVYAVSGNLFAVRFDVRSLEVVGGPIPIVEGVVRANQNGMAQFAVSSGGSMMYLPGPRDAALTTPAGSRYLARMDRKGMVTRLPLPAGQYDDPRVSPDGTHVAFGRDEGAKATIYTYDLSGATAIQPLGYGGNSRIPVWSSDGKHIAFQSDREGDTAIFWQLADGTGAPERLTKPEPGESHAPESWSPTANTLLFSVAKMAAAPSTVGGRSLSTLSLPEKKRASYGNVHSSTPVGAVFRPDGNWVAYTSTEQGKTTIYVQPFPATGEIHPLAAKASQAPHSARWSPDGKELFYDPFQGVFEAVSVKTQPPFAFGNPVDLPHGLTFNAPTARPPYDVTPTGDFIGTIGANTAAAMPGSQINAADAGTTGAPRIEVVINWFEDLKARLPIK